MTATTNAPIRELTFHEYEAAIHPALKPRELQVLQMAADGETLQSTADRLGISRQYVKHLRSFAIAKLGADSTMHAVAQALRRGIIA
jgi:LuxR family transcriptional regulator, quorum-sensing system regulator BjaR1